MVRQGSLKAVVLVAQTISRARGVIGSLLSKAEVRPTHLKYLYMDKVTCCMLFLVGSVLNFRDFAMFSKS